MCRLPKKNLSAWDIDQPQVACIVLPTYTDPMDFVSDFGIYRVSSALISDGRLLSV